MKREIEFRTEIRTPAEKALAEELRTKAASKRPSPEKFKRAARRTAAAVKSPTFEYNRLYSNIDRLPIHYFHDLDESLTGIIGPPEGENGRGSTFPFVLDSGRVIRIPGNRMLVLLVRDAGCIGQRITVTYRGKRFFRKGGNYQKVYEIKPAPEEGLRSQ